MPLTPLGRKDNSGGFMIIQYANGSYTHRARFHIDKVTTNDPSMTYQVASGTELTVFDTFRSLANLLKAWRDSSWSFSLSSIYLNTGPDPNTTGYNLFIEQFGYNLPTAIAGAGGNATSAVQAAGFQAYNMHTAAGGRFRTFIIGPGGFAYTAPYVVSGSTGGSAADQALVAYLVGNNCAVRGHDGGKLTGGAHVTYGYQARLRRHYGQA